MGTEVDGVIRVDTGKVVDADLSTGKGFAFRLRDGGAGRQHGRGNDTDGQCQKGGTCVRRRENLHVELGRRDRFTYGPVDAWCQQFDDCARLKV